MSWLLVTQDFPPGFDGGIATWARDLALALHQAGESVRVLARHTPGSEAHDQRQPYVIRRMRGRSWLANQGRWAGIYGALELGPDVRIICATWRLASWLKSMAPLRGARLSVAFHGSDLTRLSTADRGLQQVLAASYALLPNSRFIAGLLEHQLHGLAEAERIRSRIRVLPMPLALPSVPAQPGEGLVCLARLTPLKGVERAIGLADALGEVLTVIGDGEAMPALTALAEGKSVRFLGRLSHEDAMRELSQGRACILLPRCDEDGSGAEGLGLCLLEAAARGIPVIGCATGGVPEAVGPGLLLADPDRPDIDRVRVFLADRTAGIRARQWVELHHGPMRAVTVLREALS